MAFFNKMNLRAALEKNSGFGDNANNYGGRFFNKNGTANVEKRGLHIFHRISWYHTMIDLPNWKFMFVIFSFYLVINLIFALLYFMIGVENLDGVLLSDDDWGKFVHAYFFSAQTFTTVGYGHISPTGFLTSLLASAEALIGLLSFGIATGLFFGRFSKPTAFLKFSHNALISPYRDIKGLMIRMTPYKNTNFTDAEAKMTLGLSLEEDGVKVNKFYTLELELERINTLTLSWTLVHPIDEKSPLYGFTSEDFKNTRGEILVFVKTFDDMFSNTVATRTSYTFEEVIYGAKFVSMYDRSADTTKTVLHLDKLNHHEFHEL